MAGNKAVGQAKSASCRARTATVKGIALTSLAALLLAGCAADNKPRVCPFAAILAPTAETVGFKPNVGGDPSDELYRVRMTSVSSDCSIEEETRQVSSDLDITFRATRTPDGSAAQYSVPYYMAISVGDRVVAKRNFTIQIVFGPGESVVEFRQSLEAISFKVDNDKMAVAYRVLAGFQLTREQLDYLKKMERYTP